MTMFNGSHDALNGNKGEVQKWESILVQMVLED